MKASVSCVSETIPDSCWPTTNVGSLEVEPELTLELGSPPLELVDVLLLPQAASTAQAPSAASAPPTLLCDGKRYLMFM
ncbi:MAG TPA: hypothetical protein VEF89_31755 [Solirubrobacteraceae bacterium]|nr:hypothetical protein [Solirubrobacteraceae bacterium]